MSTFSTYFRHRRRQSQLRADEQVAARVEAVHACEPRQRRVPAARERRQRVTRLHDVEPGRDAHRAHRDACLEAEGGERRAAGDPVGPEVQLTLVAADPAQCRPVDVAVHGDGDAVAVEQELEDGDVPAELAAGNRARAEERRAERA